MLIPTIPHNLQPFYQIEPAIFGTGSTMNASARPPICGHDSEGFFSCSQFPHPVGAHAERNFFPGSIPEPVAPHTLCHHKDAAEEPFCPQVVRLQYCPKSALTILRHVAVPRLRLTTAGFHSRRTRRLRLVPFFSPVRWICSNRLQCQRSFHHGPINALP